MRILVFGVIYQGVEEFLHDYFNSLNNQSYLDFDILIIEDSITLPECYCYDKLIVMKNKEFSSPAEIRQRALKFAKEENYDIIIFTDCDDYFSEDRIESTISALVNHDFCVNKLIPVNVNGEVIKDHAAFITSNYMATFNPSGILNTNIFGLSNTALKINAIPKDFYIPSTLQIVDWWLFTLLLIQNRRYVFDKNPITYYRQHQGNTVGLDLYLTKLKLLKGVDVKISHYIYLLEFCRKNKISNIVPSLNELITEFNTLKEQLKNEEFLEKYLSIINKNIMKIKTGWWSEILPLKEWRNYV